MSNTDIELLKYRMQSIAIGHLAICYTLDWSDVPSIKIFFGEDQVIEGLATAFTNPAIESALIHCRALLDFLGLAAVDANTIKQRKEPRYDDDIVIERIMVPNGTLLQKVQRSEALRS